MNGGEGYKKPHTNINLFSTIFPYKANQKVRVRGDLPQNIDQSGQNNDLLGQNNDLLGQNSDSNGPKQWFAGPIYDFLSKILFFLKNLPWVKPQG